MALDVGVFGRYQSFPDYAKAEQEFQLKKQAAQLDNETKKLQFMGQVVGNSIDQDSYNKTRAFANSVGIDTSSLPEQFNPEVVSRLRFAGATPTAQLSALISSQGHMLKAGQAVGDVGAYGYGTNNGYIPTPQGTSPVNNPGNLRPVGSNTGFMQYNTPEDGMNALRSDLSAKINGSPAMNGNQPTLANIIAAYAPPSENDTGSYIANVAKMTGISPNQVLTDADVERILPAFVRQESGNKYSIPAQRAGETTQAYENRLKNDPNVQANIESAKSGAKVAGEDAAKAASGSIVSNEAYQRLMKNLDSLATLNNTLPDSSYASPETKAWLDKRTGGMIGSGAKDLVTWNAINQQQALNALQDLVKSGGGNLRSNMLIDKMIARGFIIDPDQPKEARKQEIDTVRNELKNVDISSGNINARMNGGQMQDYVDTLPQQAAPKKGSTVQGTDGTYLYNGGDPSNPASWEKVK